MIFKKVARLQNSTLAHLKFTMATVKLEMLKMSAQKLQIVEYLGFYGNYIESKFQLLLPRMRGSAIRWYYCEHFVIIAESDMVILQPEVVISQFEDYG